MKSKFVVSILACAATAALGLPAAAGARTKLVWAGGTPKFQAAMLKGSSGEALDFFPHSVTIAQGDSVQWQGMQIGFHTVDLPGKATGDLPLFMRLASPAFGDKDAAGNPFWFNGQSKMGVDSALFAPSGGHTFRGAKRVESGLPFGPPKSFRVKFAKPGTYVYFCDVHYDMRGTIVVRPKGAKIPSAAQDAASVAKQQARDTKIAKALAKTKVTGNKVSLGVGGKHSVEILGMFPKTLHVQPGTTVSFAMSSLTGEGHTATFGPNAYVAPLVGSFNTNYPAPAAFFPSSPSAPIAVPGSHGNGFASSGVLDRDSRTALPPETTFQFTTPGTYQYRCLIHPFMNGTIIVQ